ncbi:MAG TPA: M81 family metallopeptidase [Burkholderiaceae bacterium]|nr:M81 family metallopeptidase [Burkholderiaceae bacterium]
MQHETNTFAPSRADYAAFESGGGWPSIQRGEPLFEAVAGANIPVQGAIEALRAAGHALVPTTWAAASPSAHVTRDAFERIVGDLVARLRAAGPVDGVYLDLHGAMVCEHVDDGEGEILQRVREVVGPQVPVVASLDLHANVTRRMVAMADALTIYRTYPHVDMAETGARAAALLDAMIRTGRRPAKAFRQFDYLTGIPSQCTFVEPCRGLYDRLAALERTHRASIDFAPGFPMADFPECGMSAVAYADDDASARAALAAIGDAIAAAEPDFALELLEPDDAVRRAMRTGAPGAPTVLADTQDNPGAGGNGDTTGLLAAMVRQRAPDAVLGLLIDPASAARAHEAGQGATLEFALGAISGVPGHVPFAGRFAVERLGDGRFTCTGPMFRGFRMQLGKMALLREADSGVRVVLASVKCQAADQEMFRHVGVEPVRQRIVAVKSSVHFRADFQPIAREVLVVRSPGPALADPVEFAWTRLRPGLRMRPLGPVFGAAAA